MDPGSGGGLLVQLTAATNISDSAVTLQDSTFIANSGGVPPCVSDLPCLGYCGGIGLSFVHLYTCFAGLAVTVQAVCPTWPWQPWVHLGLGSS